jgi:hypothetical protein
MIKKIIIIPLFILILLNSIGQTNCDCYERLAKLASHKLYEKKTDSALFVYKRALKFLPESARNYLHDVALSQYYIRANKIDSSTVYLIKAIENGYPPESAKYNSIYNELFTSKYSNAINNSYYQTGKNFNWDFYTELYKIYGLDQAIRTESELTSFDRNTMFTKVDSINYLRLKELLNLHGYPSQLTHGFSGNKISPLLLHFTMYSEKMYEDIIAIVKKANEECLCSRSFIALMNDRRLDWYHKAEQTAGTWNRSGEFTPIKDIYVVDSIRYAYNYLSLQDYANQTGRPLPEKYTPLAYPKGYFCQSIKP